MFFLSDEMPFSFDELLLFGAASGGKAIEDTATGNPLTFLTDLARPLKSLLIPFTPQQEGTGDPSPSNIRSILPWNGLKVWQSGINLWNEEWEIGGINGTTGQNTQSDNQIRSKNYNPCSPNTQYYVNHPLSGSDMRLCWYKKDKTFISSSWKGVGATTSPADAYYFRFVMASAYGTTYNNNISINYPSTKTRYNPHTENTETDISLPSPVYGGTLDAVTGVLTVTKACETFKWSAGEYPSDRGDVTRKSFQLSYDAEDADRYDLCNVAKYKLSYDSNDVHFYVNGTGDRALVFLPNNTSDDCDVTICYKLATPQEITLTPEQITALVGNNTIWSDADGQLTAVYFKKA